MSFGRLPTHGKRSSPVRSEDFADPVPPGHGEPRNVGATPGDDFPMPPPAPLWRGTYSDGTTKVAGALSPGTARDALEAAKPEGTTLDTVERVEP